MPSVLPSSWELMPFLQLTSIQNAVIHLSSPSAESSNTVPDLEGELLLAPIAEPDAASLDERVLIGAAARAVD